MKRLDPLQTESSAVLHRFVLFPRDVSLGYLTISKTSQSIRHTNVRFRKPPATGMTESAFPVVFDTSTTRLITGTFYFAFSACFASVQLLSYMIPRSRRCRRIAHLRVGNSWVRARHDLQRKQRTADIDIDLIATFQSQV